MRYHLGLLRVVRHKQKQNVTDSLHVNVFSHVWAYPKLCTMESHLNLKNDFSSKVGILYVVHLI